MEADKIEQLLSEMEVSIEDPRFFQTLFAITANLRKHRDVRDGDNLRKVCAEEYEELSRRMDRSRIQESCSARNILRTRRLANLLISEDGEINISLLPILIKHLKTYLYSIGPDRQYDSKRQEHILHVLSLLNTNKELVILLKSISRPYQHKYADQIIRDTLQLDPQVAVTDAHARRAVLSAWMSYLRQNVGSCFATAPAILVQAEQPELFLTDIREILSTGRLKRTFGGIEYSVPLSTSWGAGELKKQFFVVRGEEPSFQFWLSPSLTAAFEKGGILAEGISIQRKAQKSKQIILKVLHHFQEGKPYFLISPEELIREALLLHLGLTLQDLINYENRSKGMFHGSLVIQNVPGEKSRGTKAHAAAQFFTRFENAKSAFKALTDNALLKSWEFTLASFAETKANFTRWNLYASLGFAPEEGGGIGHAIYSLIKTKLDESNLKVQEYQSEYEVLFTQVKYLESRIKNASTEQEVKWIKVEYQSKANELSVLQELRDEAHLKARRFADLFQSLVDMYDILFPTYFQEVYDADMHDVTTGPYDDSPAGFRLLFKHGRSNTAQWTQIQNQDEFIDALVAFFIATESEIRSSPAAEGIDREVSEIISAIVAQIRTREFLETAFYRMAIAHNTRIIKDPLNHLEQIEKKPWVYTSGGSMSTLVSAYFAREQKPTEVSRWVESPMELLVFLVDSIKQLPPKIQEEYEKAQNKSMLMHSPTHAFLLKPGYPTFKQSWHEETYTYIWLRDNFLKIGQNFVESILLDEEAVSTLLELVALQLPPSHRHYFRKTFAHLYGRKGVAELRNLLLHPFESDRGLRLGNRPVFSAEELDSYLYTALPLFPVYQLEQRVLEIMQKLPGLSLTVLKKIKTALEKFDPFARRGRSHLSARALQEICKAILCLVTENTAFPYDYHKHIGRAAQELGYAMPLPFIFADTNWIKEEFGFVVNPGTAAIELWRVDPIGTTGAPMKSWEMWLNGTRKDLDWGIYTRPYEYYK
ncbi:MAG: hypothetical protein CK425_09430 [Parachlamydia sp.]|nr:MAG: hypothetical protein CK425_09430 [Parachlamydia sp.]